MNEPILALSVRQPWAWLIVQGLKDVENRTWHTTHRGPVWIHAARGMTDEEYQDGAELAWENGHIKLPAPSQLLRGGIVGQAIITDCVAFSDSKWFCGPVGFVLKEQKIVPFKECRGMPGFFRPQFNLELPGL